MLKTGQTIAALRTKANMTQEQLASALFVSRDLVSKWETGKSPPNYQMILKMSELFAVEVETLFDKNQILTDELAPCIPSDLTLDGEELKTVVNAFLATLSIRDRAVFFRRYYYFEDASQISASYGISVGNVRTILMRTRKKLKNYLNYLKGAL